MWKKPSLPCSAGPSMYLPVQQHPAKCERAFSSAKKLIAPERSSQGDNIIEALECLRVWWNNGLIKRLSIECKMYATKVFHSQIYPSLLPGRRPS